LEREGIAMVEPGPRLVRSRLELPEEDFVALKAHAVLTRTTLGRLFEDSIAAWLDRDEPPPPPAPLGERVARYTLALPDDLHTRLKVRAVYARLTMQALVRAALTPVIAAARERERGGGA
jgi:hypothetical protein